MRLTLNILIPMMAVGLVTGVIVYDRAQRHGDRTYLAVQRDLTRLRGQAAYHGALRDVAVSRAGFPWAIDEEWFAGESLPANTLVPGQQNWLDIAPPGDMFEHPPDPIAFEPSQGGFWYNPNLGVLRARVPWEHSPARALDAYNRVNGTSLKQLPPSGNTKRRPRVHKTPVLAGAGD